MHNDLGRFHQMFFEETVEHLDAMEQLLLGVDVAAPGHDDLNAIFRAAHSIKGGAGTFGFDDLIEVTHVLETLLDRIRKDEIELRPEMIDVFLKAGDVLRTQLECHRGGPAADPAIVAGIVGTLHRLSTGDNAAAPSTGAADDEDYGFFADAPGLDTTSADTDADAGYGFFAPLETPPAAAYGFFDELPAPPATPMPTPSPAGRAQPAAAERNTAESSIRVGVDKVDQLINLVGELVITQAMLAQTATQVDPVLHERLRDGMAQLERNTRDLQESVMSIRMTPMSFVFSRFPRLVRDLAGKLGKEITLGTEGESTELDKGLIERIVDPLTHLIRNSLDHGIESPDEREAAGKPRQGSLVLRAAHKGGSVVIEVEDDGRGLDRERILAKARERGLPVGNEMSDQEVWQLIFAPGFSTAAEVTDISGRGVGMDVVKRNIDALGGRVDIASARGTGTRVTIQLPLTLAILDGMSVGVGNETFIIPLTYIVESLQPAAEDIRGIPSGNGRGAVVRVRDEYLPLAPLHRLFSLEAQNTAPGEGILVIVDTGGSRLAVMVDALLGQHQVVIKSLEANYRKVPGIAGATIMGDGRVALILDIAGLARLAQA